MGISDARHRANEKYNAKAYDEIKVRVSKGRKEEIQAEAERRGQSVNGFINGLIDWALSGGVPAGSPAADDGPGGGSGFSAGSPGEILCSRFTSQCERPWSHRPRRDGLGVYDAGRYPNGRERAKEAGVCERPSSECGYRGLDLHRCGDQGGCSRF